MVDERPSQFLHQSAFSMENTMKAKSLLSKSGLLAALLGVGIGLTGITHAADDPKAAESDFKKLDADKDGAINKEEASRMQGLPELFDAADANKDGKLDPSEFSRAAAALKK
jgi:hypothetical protein